MPLDAVRRINRLFRVGVMMLAALGIVFAGASLASAQGGGEHEKHHPGQKQGGGSRESSGGGMMGGKGGGGMMGGGKGGGMGGMMEKMGAPKPKDLYPKLMDLPDLPLEEREQIKQEAHQRMVDGTALLSNGLDELSYAAAREDFATMQAATAKMREGLSQFESGLAAHRAIAEGKAPRNVAMQWFKREMNLLPPATADPGFHFLGMSFFHTSIMLLLVAFTAAMIWMYFFKMRRATALLQTLTAAEPGMAASPPAPSSAGISSPEVRSPKVRNPVSSRNRVSGSTASAVATNPNTAEADCCDESAVECATEENATDRPDISQGLLRVAKRKLCKLRVARIYQETPDVKTFRLVACHGGALPFNYLPGQFLTVTMPTGEKPIRRSYTISSSPTQGYYCEITVKREEQGVGSRYLHDTVKEGDALEIQAPSGKFIFTGKEAQGVVLIAGGVGITPMMSITRALTDMGWSGDIHFIVACRDPEHFIFEAELQSLQQRHANLHLHVAMSRIEKDMNGYQKGRLSQEFLAESVPDIASHWIQLCGAPPMMDGTKEMLLELGVPAEKIHTENFGSQQKPKKKTAERKQAVTVPPTETAGAATVATTVTFQTSGKSAELSPDDTILEASERVGVDIDYSCRTGMCGVCIVKLLSGEVTMEAEDGLDPDDKAAGMILACQAKSTGNVTVEA